MATRIAFSTHWPDKMGDLAGERNYFPEKILGGILDSEESRGDEFYKEYFDSQINMGKSGYRLKGNILDKCQPKTQTIRQNYEYWKAKEGKMIQPFIWAGKPRHSKHIVFCPEVKLRKVYRIDIKHNNPIQWDSNTRIDKTHLWIDDEEIYFIWRNGKLINFRPSMKNLADSDGFDSVDHFFRWFDKDLIGGALLVWGDQEY